MINEYDDERKVLFLEELINHSGNIKLTCEATGISRKTFIKWKKDDMYFFEDWEDTVRYLQEKKFIERVCTK